MKLKFNLRAWQQEALIRWCENNQRGIVQVVTGGGKTIFAEACMQRFLANHSAGRFLIVVPTIALADQWAVSLEEELGLDASSIHIGHRRYDLKKHIVSILVINSARNKEKHFPLNVAWMIIVDECHRSGSNENRKALIGSFSASLGLSATPERQYDDALKKVIIPALGEIVYSYSLAEARKDNVVTPFELVNVRVDMLADEKRQYARVSRIIGMKKHHDDAPNDESIKALLRRRACISNNASIRIPVSAKLLEQHSEEKTIVFHENVNAVEAIARIAHTRGHSVITYHTGIALPIRLSNLRLYRRGVYSIMVSCRALDEGVNIPETRVAIIAAASASNRQRIQRLGRVLRPAKGKAKAVIYSLYATSIEENRLLAEAKEMEDSGTAIVRWLRVE